MKLTYFTIYIFKWGVKLWENVENILTVFIFIVINSTLTDLFLISD